MFGTGLRKGKSPFDPFGPMADPMASPQPPGLSPDPQMGGGMSAQGGLYGDARLRPPGYQTDYSPPPMTGGPFPPQDGPLQSVLPPVGGQDFSAPPHSSVLPAIAGQRVGGRHRRRQFQPYL